MGSSQRTQAQSGANDAVGAVKDAAGHPVPLHQFAVTPQIPQRPRIQRGLGWWPYPNPLPPYNDVEMRAEAMAESQIGINGIVTLDVRDPGRSLELVPRELLLQSGSQLQRAEGYYLVKLAGVSRTQEQIDALVAAGATLGEYLNVNTYIAKLSAKAVAAVRALPFVTFVGDYHPVYKISPRIGLSDVPWEEAYDAATGAALPWVLELSLHKGAKLEDVLFELGRMGMAPAAKDIVSNDELTIVYVRTTPEAVPFIAAIPGVKWIAEKTYPQLQASSTSPATIPILLQNNGAFTTSTAVGWKLWNAGIDGDRSGTAQIVTLMDTGLNTKMEHFSQDITQNGVLGASHRKVVGYDNYGGDLCVNNFSTADGGHGTWTSEHAVGSISNMTGSPDTTHTPVGNFDVGIARDAKVYFQDIGLPSGSLSAPGDLGPSITAAIGKGSFIQSHSWGANVNSYDASASNLDTALFSNPNMVVTAAAGNGGVAGASTIINLCTAKNAICVGGADAASPNSLFEDCNWDGTAGCVGASDLGSSRGPVSTSSRTKPDIITYMAFSTTVGNEIEAGNRPSAMCQSDATKTVYWDFVNINGFGGTSFATPEVAGLAALTRDYFLSGFWPTGTATPGNALTPVGSLVKAVILASGEDMNATSNPTSQAIGKRYSSDVGYGRANLPSVLHVGSSAPFLWVQNGVSLGQAATQTFNYNINGNSIPLRVMLVWYDSAGNALVKNADLTVTIGANVYKGNVLSAGWSTTGGSADATNTTEGVFLDAAHGLPASGTVSVAVIGTNNPGGMNYSLVVSGDVASSSVAQVSLDQGTYTCSDTVTVTVNDGSATSPVSVTLTSRNNVSTVIDTQVVSCTGSNGVFTGTIQTGSGIIVADGGSLTATYAAAAPAQATIVCRAALDDGGFLLSGGCDDAAAGTDEVTGPLTNSGTNEFYNRYMDGGEYTSYTFAFVNQTGAALTDATVALSFSGPGASKMSALNGPIHVGPVASGALAGAVFQLYTDPSVVGLTSVNLDFDVTSPADGFTTARRLTQTHLLHANDVITRQQQCSTFNGSLAPWFESQVAGHALNPWKWSGSATTPATVSSENRVDGACGSATANSAAMVGNSAITSGNNFLGNADSMLLQNFQPALRGNGPSGQPYHYVWKWHSFYHASETLGQTTGVWGVFYNDQWNNAVNPTGDQARTWTNNLSFFYQTIFDYVGTWNWEAANTGTPDDPRLGPTSGGAPNQLFITFNGVDGLATAGTYFAYGHEHADLTVFGGASTATTRRDVALDNDRLVYDEYYTDAQGAACGAGSQPGQVAFDQFVYGTCPTGSAVLSVSDANATSPIQVTVTSPGTGDSEVVTLTGTAPYFSGTLTYNTTTGSGNNNGVLFVLPNESITATYNDTSPLGSSTATASTGCKGGNVIYLSNAQISDNGDNDGFADNGETVTIDITIQNNLATNLTNAKVKIFSASPNVDCIFDDQALYGTVNAAASKTNPPGDRFSFHVLPAVACSDPQNPPTAKILVAISGDGLDGSTVLQSFILSLDQDSIVPIPTSYSQNFNSDPGWTTDVTAPDNAGCDTHAYTNDFHWCGSCGNAGGGYGAWVGNSAFGTGTQNYTSTYNSSTLYSPTFIANGNVGLQFQVAYRTENLWDSANVQYKVGAGAWTLLTYTTPVQGTTTANTAACSPIQVSSQAWTGTATGTAWTTTNTATAIAGAGQSIQFRWRLGGDQSVNGTVYGGYGVDNVTITNLQQTTGCEATRNSLPPCVDLCLNVTCTAQDQCHNAGVCNPGTGLCSNPAKPNGTACNDANACTTSDVCTGGTCAGTSLAPAEVDTGVRLAKGGGGTDITWNAALNATSYDVVSGLLSGLPVGPGGGDEACLSNDLGATLYTDVNPNPVPGAGIWYLVRGVSTTCGAGPYGFEGLHGVPSNPRVTSTCP